MTSGESLTTVKKKRQIISKRRCYVEPTEEEDNIPAELGFGRLGSGGAEKVEAARIGADRADGADGADGPAELDPEV
jgi:hypothetical protein